MKLLRYRKLFRILFHTRSNQESSMMSFFERNKILHRLNLRYDYGLIMGLIRTRVIMRFRILQWTCILWPHSVHIHDLLSHCVDIQIWGNNDCGPWNCVTHDCITIWRRIQDLSHSGDVDCFGIIESASVSEIFSPCVWPCEISDAKLWCKFSCFLQNCGGCDVLTWLSLLQAWLKCGSLLGSIFLVLNCQILSTVPLDHKTYFFVNYMLSSWSSIGRNPFQKPQMKTETSILEGLKILI